MSEEHGNSSFGVATEKSLSSRVKLRMVSHLLPEMAVLLQLLAAGQAAELAVLLRSTTQELLLRLAQSRTPQETPMHLQHLLPSKILLL